MLKIPHDIEMSQETETVIFGKTNSYIHVNDSR
jgi:hypothetical protein